MKKRSVVSIIWIGVVVFVLMTGTLIINLYNKGYLYSNNVPDNYIAVFNGGSGEVTYSTYIYKIDNDQANYGFKYINTRNMTKSWGSSEWDVKVVGRGEFSWTDEAFSIAYDNGAYSYVSLKDGSNYSIDEFRGMFLMN